MEVELPEIHNRINLLNNRRNDVLHKKPSYEEVLEHSSNYMRQRKETLENRINNRLQKIQSYSQLDGSLIRTKTMQRIKLHEELEKAIQEETKENKHRQLKRRHDFGKRIKDYHSPAISQKKREEMQKIIDIANASAREKVRKIRYQRPQDSILNKSELLNQHFGNSTGHRLGGSPRGSDEDSETYSKTLAFGKRADSGEYSPSKAYIAVGDLEPVKERWGHRNQRTKHTHARSKSSFNGGNRDSNRSVDIIYPSQRNSVRIIEPVDWLVQRRKERAAKGGHMYKAKLPTSLGTEKDRLSSFRDIKDKVGEVERQASRLEKEALDSYNTDNLVRDNLKLGSMLVDAIKAKAMIIHQL